MAYKKTGGILTVQGLDTSKPAEYISETNTPNCQNMAVIRNVLKKRIGTELIGVQISGTQKEILAIKEFEREQIAYVVRVGLDRIEEWNASTTTWDNVTGSDLTGTTTDPVDTAVPLLSGKKILVFTNFVDNIRKYTGTGNTADLGGTPDKARYCVAFGTYLVLAYIDDGSIVRTMRVAWSDTGDPETWTGGNSGSKDLTEDGEDITGLSVFGNYLSVHKKTSIYLGYLVDTTATIKFERKSTEVGTICNATIQNIPGEQIFLAQDGIRKFNGISAQLIESPVTDEIRESLNYEYIHKCWSVLVPEYNEYWVGIPIGSQTTGDTVYKYNYLTGVCHKDTRSNISAVGTYSQTSQPSWDDEDGTWDQDTERWDDAILSKDFPVILLGDNSGYTYQRKPSILDDNDVAIDAYWESKDFTSEEQGRFIRAVSLELWAKGQSVTVDYSIDAGSTWNNISTKTLTDNYPTDASPLMLYFDVVATRLRFRFRNNSNDSSFSMKQFILSYMDREVRR